MRDDRFPGAARRMLEEAWRLLEAHGQATAVSRLRDRMHAEAGSPATLVVVGEAKRGKSSLINALLGVDVAPVGVDIVTGAYVAYVPVTLEHELPPGSGRVILADGSYEDMPLDEVAAWVTVPGRSARDDRGVVSAMVRLRGASPLDMVVVDTPGWAASWRRRGN